MNKLCCHAPYWRSLSVALYPGKNSSALGGGVCINRVECEFPFSTFSFFFSFFFSLSLPSFLLRSTGKRATCVLFIYTVERVRAYDRRVLLMREADIGRQRTGRDMGKIHGGDHAWRWFHVISERMQMWKKILILARFYPPPFPLNPSLSFFRGRIFKIWIIYLHYECINIRSGRRN